jgi:hypothetical protein
MDMEGAVEEQRHTLLTSTLDRTEWRDSGSGRFTYGERDSDTHWIGSWVGPEPVWTL